METQNKKIIKQLDKIQVGTSKATFLLVMHARDLLLAADALYQEEQKKEEEANNFLDDPRLEEEKEEDGE